MVGLCTTPAQVQQKYMTALNDAEYVLEFGEKMKMVDIRRSLVQMVNWLGMPVQVQCTLPRPEQLKTLHCRNNYSDTTLTTSETQEEVRSQIEGISQVVEQLIKILKKR